jgi:phosphoglycolate phosphatase
MIASSHMTAQYMKLIGFDKKVYVIGSKTLNFELENVGIKTFGHGPDIMGNSSLQAHVMTTLKTMEKEVGAVVVGFDEHFSFPKLFKAVNYLKNPEVKFIATNDDQKIDFP